MVAPENEQYRGRMIGEIAEEEGRSAWEVLVAVARADELNTSFGTVPAPETDDDWKARIQVWRDRWALIGASDAGAHLDLLASFNYATEVLGKAVRQRKLLPMEEAINLITDTPAQLYGLKERGRLADGWKADVVVLDPETVGSHDVRMRMDLPGGAGPALRRGRRHRPRPRERHRHRARRQAHRRPQRHAPALRPRHPDRLPRDT